VKQIKFIDEDKIYLNQFGDIFLVVCPSCENCAKVIADTSNVEVDSKPDSLPHKVVCLNCSYYDWTDVPRYGKQNFDWYFRLPLWLEMKCCGEVLWAYNLSHLEFIEDYVGALLRNRKPCINASLASRLPKWIKEAKNREPILKCIKKLKAKISHL